MRTIFRDNFISESKMTMWADNIKFVKDIIDGKYQKIDSAAAEVWTHLSKHWWQHAFLRQMNDNAESLLKDPACQKSREHFLSAMRVLELVQIGEIEMLLDTITGVRHHMHLCILFQIPWPPFLTSLNEETYSRTGSANYNLEYSPMVTRAGRVNYSSPGDMRSRSKYLVPYSNIYVEFIVSGSAWQRERYAPQWIQGKNSYKGESTHKG